jgi:hypothetical protein
MSTKALRLVSVIAQTTFFLMDESEKDFIAGTQAQEVPPQLASSRSFHSRSGKSFG